MKAWTHGDITQTKPSETNIWKKRGLVLFWSFDWDILKKTKSVINSQKVQEKSSHTLQMNFQEKFFCLIRFKSRIPAPRH